MFLCIVFETCAVVLLPIVELGMLGNSMVWGVSTAVLGTLVE